MIYIKEDTTKKQPGKTSLFIKFDYSPIIVETIKTVGYGVYNKKDTTWEFPATTLSQLIQKLQPLDDIDLELLDVSDDSCNNEKLISTYKTIPFEYQEDAIRYGLMHDKWLLLDPPGLGKAFSFDTRVLTLTGYIKISDLHVGDDVFDECGNPCKVTAIYDHSDLSMYRITFNDGTFFDCCKDHLWQFDCVHQENYKNKFFTEVKNTEWLYNNWKKNIIKFPLCQPVNFPAKNITIDPYLLGCLLGDGSFRANSVYFCCADQFILDKISEKLPENITLKKAGQINYRATQITPEKSCYSYIFDNKFFSCFDEFFEYLKSNHLFEYQSATLHKYINEGLISNSLFNKPFERIYHKKNILVEYIDKLGLLDTSSHTKFIPDNYKYNTADIRLSLVQGLIDTDGYAAKGNVLQYSTVSKALAEDVAFIVESFGDQAVLHKSTASYKGSVPSDLYTITIRSNDVSKYTSLPRKKERLHRRKRSIRKTIKDIVKIDNCSGRCITVDSASHLYLVDHCCVAHNTLTSIYLAQERYARKQIEHCLIICGINTLKANWKKEILRHSDLSCRILGEYPSKKGDKLLYGGLKERIEQLKNPIEEFFVITNVESLRNEELVKAILNGPNKFDMIILDELHKTKSVQSQQGHGLLKLKAKYQVGLTGTLIVNNPLDAYTALKWLDKDNSTLTNFKYYYCNYAGPFHNILTGFKNTQVLKDQIEDCSLRRPKDLLNLPPKTIINEEIDLAPDQEKFYKNIVNGIVEQVDKVNITTSSLLAMLTRLRQATSCPSMLTTENVSSSKIERCCDLVEEIVENGEKIVVFSQFKEPLKILEEKLSSYDPLLCTGDIKDSIISDNIDKFQNSNENKVMLCTSQKMGTGITLTAATYAIFIDSSYTRALNEQCEERIYRIGSSKPVFIYYLWNTDTVDMRVKEIVEDKSMISDYMIDDKCSPHLLKRLKEIIIDL